MPRALGYAVITLILIGTAAWPGVGSSAATVKFIAREFSFHPSEVAVRAGEVTFEVTHEGVIEHTFVLEDRANRVLAEIASIAPGKTEVTRARIDPGAYLVFCRVPGHREAGMTATLKVGQ